LSAVGGVGVGVGVGVHLVVDTLYVELRRMLQQHRTGKRTP